MLTLLILAAWIVVGMAGYVYWWTTEFDFETSEIPMAFCMGFFMGPLTWIVGGFIHSDRPNKNVLRKKRGR
jgi:hypothetical protein